MHTDTKGSSDKLNDLLRIVYPFPNDPVIPRNEGSITPASRSDSNCNMADILSYEFCFFMVIWLFFRGVGDNEPKMPVLQKGCEAILQFILGKDVVNLQICLLCFFQYTDIKIGKPDF